MTITAEVIADSVNKCGNRLTTFVLKYPRFIHSEFMTHRLFSRNAASSRAIPVRKMIENIKADLAMPIHWGKNEPGMQASVELDYEIKRGVIAEWHQAARSALRHAESMLDLGVHKQVANRILEPFQHITVICSATEWDNFFKLRLHKDAQPEICELAKQMRVAMDGSIPVETGWHLPFSVDSDAEHHTQDIIMACAARCARVSYLTHDGVPDFQKDLQLAKRLAESGHWSPFEHVAQAMEDSAHYRNFRGWLQLRASGLDGQ